MLKNTTIALGAGFIGGIANVFAIYFINSLQNLPEPNHVFMYKQVFWGGIWALLYVLPLFKLQWYIKGMIVGALASVCTFLIFNSLPITPVNLIKAFLVNIVVWGGVSSFCYYKAVGIKKHHQ